MAAEIKERLSMCLVVAVGGESGRSGEGGAVDMQDRAWLVENEMVLVKKWTRHVPLHVW